MRSRTLRFLPIVFSLLLLITSCSSSSETVRTSLLEQIKQRGTIRVGVSTFVPWAMRNTQGELIGFEVDVANRLADDANLKVEFVPTAFDGIVPGLLAGKFDVIIAGMSITPQRNLSVNFTQPYAHSGLLMAANKQLAGHMIQKEAYNTADVTITVRRGSISVQAAQKTFPKATLRQFDDDAQAFQEVLNGNAHAVIASTPKPEFETIRNSDKLFIPFEGYLDRGVEAIGVRQGELDALNFFNNWILLRTEDGWLEERHDYWFKTLDWQNQVPEGQ
jgi:polar amino acid transport system substrate-binding protein